MPKIDLRGTLYHSMERRGAFANNPANVGATNDAGEVIYKGPVKYPMMLYSPTGEFRVTDAGVKVKDVDGSVQLIGRQQELVSKVVNSTKEEAEAKAAGWHDHPSKALAAGVQAGHYDMAIPPMSSAARIDDLESEIERLQAELEASKSARSSEMGAKSSKTA